MSNMITVPATIDKDQISPLGELKGKANAKAITIGGEDHDPGHLQFCGFAGARGPDKRWHGVFRFEPCIGGSCPVVAFDFLKPRSKPQAPQASQAPKAAKGASNERK